MVFELELSATADKKFKKIKNKGLLRIIWKKIQQILQNPHYLKPLKADLHGARRVHINSHVVLVYELENKIVRVLDFDHHDNVY